MKPAIRRILYLIIALAIVGAIVYALLPRPVPVDLAEVTRGPLTVVVEEEGETRIRERYVVSAPLSGRIRRVDVDPGDPVEGGQTLLAAIDPVEPALLDARALAEAEARVRVARAAQERAGPEVERALAAAEYAELDLRRIREAFERGAATPQEVDLAELTARTRRAELRSAQFDAEVARFEVELAEAALLRTRPTSESPGEPQPFEIRSPVDGRVLRVLQESAAVVSPGTPLVEVGDPTDLEIVIDVLSSDAVRIRPGAPITLERWGGSRPLRAAVRVVEPAGFTKISALGVEEQRVNIVADFTSPQEDRAGLGDAYRVEAAIEVWSDDDVLRVPTSALFRHEGQWAVFVADRGRARLRTVTIGERNASHAAVLDGLKEGEQVLIYPSDRVRDGVAVVERS